MAPLIHNWHRYAFLSSASRGLLEHSLIERSPHEYSGFRRGRLHRAFNPGGVQNQVYQSIDGL